MLRISELLISSFFVQIAISQIHCSFIDINQPILFRDTNAGDSYFGYSITATKSHADNLGTSISSIYIGTPKGNNSIGNDEETGIIWACKLTFSDTDDAVFCNVLQNLPVQRVPTRPTRDGYSECCNANGFDCYKEIPQKMWLGNSISTIGDQNEIVSCGYRWGTKERRSNSSRVNGICYHASISENVKGGGRTVATVTRLKPPLHPDDQFTPVSKNVNDHLWFYGEFGFSSIFEPNRNLLLIGAPGYYHWKGTVVLFKNFNSPDVPCGRLNTVNSLDSQGEPMDYMGYTVTTGNFYIPNEYVFATGAPRGRSVNSKGFLSGYVAILSITNPFFNAMTQISYSERIIGNQFGSYFGSVLASADVNGDGLDELIIGAPMYSTGVSSDSFDEGCVFIYTNKGTVRRGLRLMERLCSNRESGGRFGSAIANMGDVNQDGFKDIAISAPLSRSGTGEVYIFYGSSNKLSDNPENPIVIRAENVNPQIKGFGYSLFGNVDIDGNGTPDLVIGSYTSKQLALYRTRSKLDIVVQVISYVTNSKKIEKFRRDDKDFVINACILTQRKPDLDGNLNIWVQVTADFDTIGTERFRFAESNQRTLLFNIGVSKGQCTAKPIFVTLVGELQPADMKKISFHWKVWYNETYNLTNDVRTFDISGIKTEKVVPARRRFCSHCPVPTEMEYQHSIPLANDNCDSDRNPICSSDLSINAGFIGDSKKIDKDSPRNDYVIGSDESRYLEISVKNAKETAYAPNVELKTMFQTEEMAKNVQIVLHDQHQGCSNETRELEELEQHRHYKCEVPLHHDKTMKLRFKLTFGNLRAKPQQEKIIFHILTYPQLHREQSQEFSLELIVKSEFKLEFKKSKTEPRLPISLLASNQIQSFVNSYQIVNSGLSPLESVKLVFKIPVNRTIDGKSERVLRVAEPLPKELRCTTTDPLGFTVFDPVVSIPGSGNTMLQNATGPVISRRRKRRQTENQKGETPKTPGLAKSGSGKSIVMGCEEPTNWKCVIVTCNLTIPLESRKPINVDLKLAIVSQIASQIIPKDARVIIVTTSGEASVFDDNIFNQLAFSSTTLELLMDEDLEAWIVFVAGVGGLVLFLLMTFCLFKCGFFRRKTKEDLQVLKARAQEEDLLARNFPNVEQADDDQDGIE